MKFLVAFLLMFFSVASHPGIIGSTRSGMEQYTTSNILSDLEAVRKDIGVPKVWLMGHSKGGALVLNYAFQNKKRVNGIILIDASGGVNAPPEKMQAVMEQKAVMPIYFSTTEKFGNCKDLLTETSLSYHAFKGQRS